MSLPYVKLGNEESINARRNLLSSEINLLNLLKKLREYKKLRKAELTKKSMLKASIRQETAKINILLRELPEIEKMHRKKEAKIEAENKRSVESELEQIKKKLESL